MDAHIWKQLVSTVRGVGGSRVDVFVVPGRCDVRSCCRSVSVFQIWTCVDVVVGLVDHFARDYDGVGCDTWSGVRAGRLFRACILVRGDIFEVPRSIDLNRVTTLKDRYNSTYPCTAGSRGIFIVQCVPARAASGQS